MAAAAIRSAAGSSTPIRWAARKVLEVRIGIATYRTLSVLNFALLIAAVYFATVGRWSAAWFFFGSLLLCIAFQSLLLRCPHCSARPGLWLLAIWTLLLDYEFYLADALLLRRCPRCDRTLSLVAPA